MLSANIKSYLLVKVLDHHSLRRRMDFSSYYLFPSEKPGSPLDFKSSTGKEDNSQIFFFLFPAMDLSQHAWQVAGRCHILQVCGFLLSVLTVRKKILGENWLRLWRLVGQASVYFSVIAGSQVKQLLEDLTIDVALLLKTNSYTVYC